MRSVATLLIALFLLLLQSTVLEFAPVHMVTPALGLIVVLHLGLSEKWTASSAALVAFATGYLFDLVSGAPRGVHAFVFVLMSLFARAVAARLAVRGLVFKAATSFMASLVAAVLVVVIRAQVSHEGGYGGLRQAPFEALLTGLFGPPVLWLLARVDGRLDPARLRVGLARRKPRTLGGLPPR
ncbi:MAG TPA: rod shape-determining protein MreD [Polyangia bacterium]|nr:rod shape-determining protein MreD [Polyangia bacterium]